MYLPALLSFLIAQQSDLPVKLVKIKNENQVRCISSVILCSPGFIYPDSLEKPVLFPIYDAGGITVTRADFPETRDRENQPIIRTTWAAGLHMKM